MRRLLSRYLADQGGATAIEYGLIAALLSVVVCGAIIALGDQLYTLLGRATTAITNH